MKAQRVDTWAAAIKDKPGALAAKFKALSTASANLEFVIARRSPEKRGAGVVFVTPIKGPKQCGAAGAAGFKKTKSLHTVRLEGVNKRGQGARLTQALADKGSTCADCPRRPSATNSSATLPWTARPTPTRPHAF